MKMCVSLLVLICLAGCHSRAVLPRDDDRLSAQAEWAFARSSLPETLDFSLPPVPDDSTPPDEGAGGFEETKSAELPVVCVCAPEWAEDAREFRQWMAETDMTKLPFGFEIIPDGQIPEHLTEFPVFVYGETVISGWKGFDDLSGKISQIPYSSPGRRRDRKEKREHDVPMGAVNQSDLIPLILGDGVTVNRSGPAVSIPVGGGVQFIVPAGMQAEARQEGGESVISITAGNPTIRLPWVGRIWPIKVDGMRLSAGMLTVELDGWKDYQIRVLP